MVAFYLMWIGAGKMTLKEVPPKWHDEVERKLKKA